MDQVKKIPEKRDHYFSKYPSSEFKEYQVHSQLRNMEFEFMTAKGVFSPKKVDLGTTVLCKRMEIPDFEKGGLVLDMGCGYGVLGIVAGKVNPNLTVHFIDINNRSIELAKKNARLNKIPKFKAFHGDYLDVMQNNGAYYDSIFFNPPIRTGQDNFLGHIIHGIKYLKEKGSMFIVVKKKLGAASVNMKITEKLEEMGNLDKYKLEIIAKNSGFWVSKISKEY